MEKRHGNPVKPAFELPPGFELREDEDFVYLYDESGKCKVFNAEKTTGEVLLAECRRGWKN